MVQTLKSLIEKSSDPYLALLAYRSTPLPWCGLSPAQLLMGRPLRTDVPQLPANLTPEWSYLPDFREKERMKKLKQKANYDRRHRVRDLPDLSEDESVWVRTRNRTEPGRVITSLMLPDHTVSKQSREIFVETEPTSPHDQKATPAVQPTPMSRLSLTLPLVPKRGPMSDPR